KAKEVQAEVKTDLVPIFAPEGKVSPEEADLRIGKLIRKLNEIESKTEWKIEPIDYEWWDSVDEYYPEYPEGAFRPLAPDEVESTIVLMHVSAELDLLGYRWRFGSSGKGIELDFSRELLHQIILDAFKSGAIARFRSCPHCKAFFVAADARQQFCSDDHRNEF